MSSMHAVPNHTVLKGAEARIEPMAQPSARTSVVSASEAAGLRCRNASHPYHPQRMSEQLKTIGILASTYRSFERQVDQTLRDVPADRVISISYSTSRLFTIFLQHHALIVIREP